MLDKETRDAVARAVRQLTTSDRPADLRLKCMAKGYWAVYARDMGGVGYFKVITIPERPTMDDAYRAVEVMLLKYPTYLSTGQLRAVMGALRAIVETVGRSGA